MNLDILMGIPVRNGHQLLFDNLIWLDSKDAADYLRITANALRVMVCKGKLSAYKLGRRLRFRKQDLDSLFMPLTTEVRI